MTILDNVDVMSELWSRPDQVRRRSIDSSSRSGLTTNLGRALDILFLKHVSASMTEKQFARLNALKVLVFIEEGLVCVQAHACILCDRKTTKMLFCFSENFISENVIYVNCMKAGFN
uniref:Uncharacterized protein n=1 Tax=Glossina pallidipes TaxID=7398 RepID=A0A1B0A091_GLOPL